MGRQAGRRAGRQAAGSGSGGRTGAGPLASILFVLFAGLRVNRVLH